MPAKPQPPAIDVEELTCGTKRYGINKNGTGKRITLTWRKGKIIILRQEAGSLEIPRKEIEECQYGPPGCGVARIVVPDTVVRGEVWKTWSREDSQGFLVVQVEMNKEVTQTTWRLFQEVLKTCTHSECMTKQKMDDFAHPQGQVIYSMGSHSLTRESFGQFMGHCGWLNDENMNICLRLYFQELCKRDPGLKEHTYIASTSMWPKLDPGLGKRIQYTRVRKWTKNLFNMRFIVIPINKDHHWKLAIVYYPKYVLEIPQASKAAPGRSEETPKCIILLFDSLSGDEAGQQRYFRIIREYLKAEAREKAQKDVETLARKAPVGYIEDRVVPQQPNLNDCGIYVLHFFDQFFKNVDKIVQGGKTIADDQEWKRVWEPEVASTRRTRLLKEIDTLSHEWLNKQLS